LPEKPPGITSAGKRGRLFGRRRRVPRLNLNRVDKAKKDGKLQKKSAESAAGLPEIFSEDNRRKGVKKGAGERRRSRVGIFLSNQGEEKTKRLTHSWWTETPET